MFLKKPLILKRKKHRLQTQFLNYETELDSVLRRTLYYTLTDKNIPNGFICTCTHLLSNESKMPIITNFV